MKLSRVLVLSVVPSPYQRDLFRAMAQRMDLRVCYLESNLPDSPWPHAALESWERVLPGRWFALGPMRFHINRDLPEAGGVDLAVLNGFTSWTAQRMMRKRLRSVRWVFWGEILREQHGAARRLARRILLAPLGRADGIVAIGRRAADDYRRRFPALPVFDIPYHCDLVPFAAEARPPRSNGVVFLFCGQMIARKGLDHLLEAFARLIAAGTDAKLRLVGWEADLPAMLGALGQRAKEKVEYAGFCAPSDLPREFARADVFVLPSRHDGWGVVVNQALGAGLPLICSDGVGAAHDLLEEGVNGTRFCAGDVGALAAAMGRLAGDPELRARWGAASAQKAWDWTPERGAERWLEVLRAVAGNAMGCR